MQKKYGWLFLAALMSMAGCDDSDSKSPEPAPAGDCQPRETRCFEDVMQTCSADKVWENTPCTAPKVCSEASGTAECAEPAGDCEPDQKRCHEGVMQTCSADKAWENTPCSAPKVCSEASGTAECVAEANDCTSGEIKCVDDGASAELWTCSASGSWNKTSCPVSTIEGARLTCRNATACVTYECTESGSFFNSVSQTCDAFSHANNCQAGRKYCNSDTNYLYECLETDNESPLLATDCGAEGKTCVKINNDEAVCVKEQCTVNFCDGDTLVFCTADHQIAYEDGNRSEINCIERGRICDLNEDGAGECTDPCTPENGVVCNSSDETHKTYFQCVNQHWGAPKTCEGNTTCQNIEGRDQCK